jgi:hypothetical protein
MEQKQGTQEQKAAVKSQTGSLMCASRGKPHRRYGCLPAILTLEMRQRGLKSNPDASKWHIGLMARSSNLGFSSMMARSQNMGLLACGGSLIGCGFLHLEMARSIELGFSAAMARSQ